MQFVLPDRTAIAFSQYFYDLLADGYRIHEALAQTRIQLRARRTAEWVAPVLFMRSSDGKLVIDEG